MGVTDGAAVARGDGAGAHGVGADARRAARVRFVAIEMVHGSAGSTAYRRRRRTCGRRRRSARAFDLIADQPERRSSRSATT